jgi:hypothetical protein
MAIIYHAAWEKRGCVETIKTIKNIRWNLMENSKFWE